jgi:hypothetical protein
LKAGKPAQIAFFDFTAGMYERFVLLWIAAALTPLCLRAERGTGHHRLALATAPP